MEHHINQKYGTPGGNMTLIEEMQYKIELLTREQKYIQEDIEDHQEKIEEEKEINKLYMED